MRTRRHSASHPVVRTLIAGVLCVTVVAGCSSSDSGENADGTSSAQDSTPASNDESGSEVLKFDAELVEFAKNEAGSEPEKFDRDELVSMLSRTPGSFFLTSKRVSQDKTELYESLGRSADGDFVYDAKSKDGSFHFRFVKGETYLKVQGAVSDFFKGGDALGGDGWEVVPHELTRAGQDWAIPSGVDANPFSASGGIASLIAPDVKLTVGEVETRSGVKVRRYTIVDAQGSEWSLRVDADGRLRSLENKRQGNMWEFTYGITVQAPKGAKQRPKEEIEELLAEGDMDSITEFALAFNDQLNKMQADVDGNPVQSADRRVMALVHSALHGELPQGVSVSADGKVLYGGTGEHTELEGLPEKVTYLEFTKRAASVCLRLTADGKKDGAHQDDLKVGQLLKTKGASGWAIMYRSVKDAACSKVK